MTPRVLTTVPGAVACDAFWSPDDDLCHAVVLTRDGRVTDVVYDSAGGVREAAPVGVVDTALDITAFWSEADDERNVTLVTTSGQVPHFRQKGSASWTTIRRRDVTDAQRIAGYDFHHHGIVLTRAGRITDEPFHGVTAVVQHMFVQDTAAALAKSGRSDVTVAPPASDAKDEPAILVATAAGIVDIAALWADGQNRFVIAAGEDGTVTEFGYGMHQPQTRRVLATIPGVRRVNACYLGDPENGRRVVALTSAGAVHVLRFGTGHPAGGPPLTTMRAQDIGCFPKGDGLMRIVLLAGDEVVEVGPDAT